MRQLLIVNKSAVMRKILRTRIVANITDATVFEAETAEDVFEAVKLGGINLVLYSAETQGENLAEIYLKVKEFSSEESVSFLILTSEEPGVEVQEALEAGADGSLPIPCSLTEMVEAVNKACNPVAMRRSRRYSIPETIARLEQRRNRFEATVINISEGGALCEVNETEDYRWSAPSMLNFEFFIEGKKVRVPKIFAIPVHLSVVQSNPDYTASRLRIAFCFANLSEYSRREIQRVFTLAKVEEQDD